MAESAIKKEILAYLAQLPNACFMTRISGMMEGGNKTRYSAGQNGTADIIGVYLGIPIAIEVKKPLGKRGGVGGAKQLASQIQWQLAWENAGGLYILARSLEAVTKPLLDLWQGRKP